MNDSVKAEKDSEVPTTTKWECKRYPHTSRCDSKRLLGKCPGKSRGKYCSRLSTMTEPKEKTRPGFAGRIVSL